MRVIFKQQNGIIIIILIWLILLTISLNSTGQKVDEFFHHIPTLKNFSKYGVIETITSDKYQAANTPLPYLINLPFVKIFLHFNIRDLSRLVTAIVALLTIFLLYYLLYKYNKNFVLFYNIIILFYPYFLKYGFSFYMGIYGLFFFILSIVLFYLAKNEKHYYLFFLVGFSLSLSILSQQYFLAIVPAFLVVFLYDFLNKTEIDTKNMKEFFLKNLLFILPLILFTLPLFILWGGLVTKNFEIHSLEFDRTNLTVQLLGIGGALLPITILNFHRVKRSFYYFIPLAMLCTMINYPKFNYIAGKYLATGITFHFVEIINNLNKILGYLVKIIIILSGIVVIILIIKKANDRLEFLLQLSFIFLFIGNLFNVLLAERHLLPLIVIAYLLLINSISNKKYLFTYLIVQIFVGTAYYFYYLYFQTSY